MKTTWIVIALLIAILIGIAYVGADYYDSVPDDYQKTYVGRDSCIECHKEQADLFAGSHHDKAMDLATEETVLASFDGQTLNHHGLTSKMFRDGDKFMVRTDGEDGQMQDFQVKYVFGVHPLQQYMVEMPQPSPAAEGSIGRLQVLRESWDTDKQKWFYLSPSDVDERLDPADPLHWTGSTQRWNTSCAECHSTNLQKNFDIQTASFYTTFSEIDVSCEACHGPGSLHVELANSDSLFWDRKEGYGLNKLKTPSNLAQVETCAPCHSRRAPVQSGYVAGNQYDSHYRCQMLVERIYHADGQIRDEDYVYGSFIQSKMFHNNIRCSDCHDPHSTKLKHEGNMVCTSCHQHPASKYDSTSHHFHKPGTPGSQCVDCHMPATTYMTIDPRRDHSFRVPDPSNSLNFGTPNACTGCHLNSEELAPENQTKVTQYLDWIQEAESGNEEISKVLDRVNREMVDATEKWYPNSKQNPNRTTYYTDLANVLTNNDSEQAIKLLANRDYPTIIRATSALELGNDGSQESLESALRAIKSPQPMLATAALGRVEREIITLNQRETKNIDELIALANTIGDLLSSNEPQVRIDAARAFALFSKELRELTSTKHQQDFEKAMSELEQSFDNRLDMESSHLLLYDVYQSLIDWVVLAEQGVDTDNYLRKAKTALENAIKVSPNRAQSRRQLATLLGREIQIIQNRMRSASPEQIPTIISWIEKLKADAQRLRREEFELLAIDIKRSEGLAIVVHDLHHRYALSSYLQKEYELAEKHFRISHEAAPENERYILALAFFFEFRRDFSEAKDWARKLVKLNPDNLEYKMHFKNFSDAERAQNAAEKERIRQQQELLNEPLQPLFKEEIDNDD